MSKDRYPNIFSRQMEANLENWGIFLDIPQFKLWNIRSHDVFRPIAHERKYLMDYIVMKCFASNRIPVFALRTPSSQVKNISSLSLKL